MLPGCPFSAIISCDCPASYGNSQQKGEIQVNTLFYGDNLDVMRKHLADQSVDLVYL